MTYITASGEAIPQGPDAFNPPTQFKTWADAAANWHFYTSRPTVSDRNDIAAPELREGLLCYVEADQLIYVWDGSAWVLAAIPGVKRHLSQFLTGSGVATGATLGTQAVPSIPIASKLIVRMTGDVGFAGANGSHGVAVTASAGTINESASTGTMIRTATTTPNWHAYARVVEVAVAASTAVTLTFKADSSVDGHYRIHTDVEVVPAGEY